MGTRRATFLLAGLGAGAASAAALVLAAGSPAGEVRFPPAVTTAAAPAPAATAAQASGRSGAYSAPAAPSHLPMTELAYFGAAWPSLELHGPNAIFVLGGGYRNAHVVRDPLDQTYVAGIVEKADAAGRVTDVILAFSGTQDPSEDNITDNALFLGTGDRQTQLAETLLDQIMTDPRYANADVHLSGHSMGGAMAIWLWGHALKSYGAEVAHRRVSATAFAAPPWGNGAMLHFGLSEADFGNYVQNYAAENDYVQSLGVVKLGVLHLLQPYQPFNLGGGVLDQAGNFALTMGHHPIAMVLGLGLPDWLTADQQYAIHASMAVQGGVDSWERDYGVDGSVAQKITGDAVDDAIFGSDSGDTILGAGGADTLTGGPGADSFVYRAGDSTAAATDRIADFRPGEGDRIDLRQIDANPGSLTTDPFRFVGRSMPGEPGQVGYLWSGPDTLVVARSAGSDADLVIRLTGHINLRASDFLL